MDLDYYRRRLAEATASAKSAIEPCARIAHQKMAHAYAKLVRNTDLSLMTAPPSPRGSTQDDTLGRWETDGGAPERNRPRRSAPD